MGLIEIVKTTGSEKHAGRVFFFGMPATVKEAASVSTGVITDVSKSKVLHFRLKKKASFQKINATVRSRQNR